MAVQAGYEAFHSWRRKCLTVICLLLASAVAMGTSVYVDSYSIHEWSRVTDIGPISVSVSPGTSEIESKLDEIRNIDGIERAFPIAFVEGRLGGLSQHEFHVDEIASMDLEYYEGFPSVFQIQTGRFPKNASEIVVAEHIAAEIDLHVDDRVNCTRGVGPLAVSDNLRVVGLFDIGRELVEAHLSPIHIHCTIGIVVPELLIGLEPEVIVHADIDRTPLTPFNAQGSLLYVRTIEVRIKEVDSQYTVRNSLAYSISNYMDWQASARLKQLLRAGGLILLIILLDFLAVRHNFNERRYERNMLLARGASRTDADMIIIRELGILSAAGTVIGMLIGVLLSRLALSSIGYFRFDTGLFFSEPFLITLESLVLSGIVGFLVPFFALGGYFLIFRIEEPVLRGRGGLAKLVIGLRLIRWDLLVLGLSSLTIMLLYSLGIQALVNPYLSTVLSVLPLVLFVAVSSLTIKALRLGSLRISKAFERAIGKLPARIGIRRVGKSASSAAPVVVVLVLAISLAWNMTVMAASLPETKMNHARFAFGGDVSFHMDSYYAQHWKAFFENVSSHPMTEHMALVSATDVFLSAEYEGRVSLVAINPLEYSHVGYDYTGSLLNESSIMSELLRYLDSSTPGVIITNDIAQEYRFSVGDTLRASLTIAENETQILVYSVVGIVAGLSDASEKRTDSAMPNEFAKRVIWVNKKFLAPLLNFTESASNVLCVNTREDGNSTKMAHELVNGGGYAALEENGWVTVSGEVSNYISYADYSIDRAVDTMTTASMILIVCGGFSLYALEDLRTRKREVALIRSMGAETSHVVKIHAAELLVLVLSALILLMWFSPVLTANSLLTHPTTNFAFPIKVFVIIPWYSMLSILMCFIACMLVLVLIVAITNTRVNLSRVLNDHWTEGSPYLGEEP